MLATAARYCYRMLTQPSKSIARASEWAGVALSSRGYLGTHIYDHEWDLLILLDTCRIDALKAVADEYEFLHRDQIETLRSRGGSSVEWMSATFQECSGSELRDTAYLTRNGYSDFVFNAQGDGEMFDGSTPPDYYYKFGKWKYPHASELGRLEELWKLDPSSIEGPEYGHSEGGAGPRFVTDRAIAVGREHDYDRMILHYVPPHTPYISEALSEDRALYDYEHEPWDHLQSGGDRQKVLRAYLSELRYVLDDIELLLENIDAENVVISSDHGESFGEQGFLNHPIGSWKVYSHPVGSIVPAIRNVPWAKTTATDNQTYEPTTETPGDEGRDVDEVLDALGYK